MAASNRYKRTTEDANTVIAYAKLNENELKPVTQVLYLNEHVTQEYKLLELDATMLNNLQAGQSFSVRGEKEDTAVLCTENTTYEIKLAETSNSMLLLSDLKFANDIPNDSENRILEERHVVGVFHNYFELCPCKPQLRKFLQALEQSQYRGKEFEEDLLHSTEVTMYTYEELLQIIQASRQELDDACKEFLVCSIGEFYRRLQHEYQFQVVTYILNLIEENSWPLNGLIRSITMDTLSELVEREILQQVFDWLTNETDETDDEGEPLCELDERKVCRFLGEVLLRPAGLLSLSDFLMVWQESVPEGMTTHLHYLDGIALIDRKGNRESIFYYPETDLPEDVFQRIHALFKQREKWTLEEIRPYIQRLATDQMNVNAMLTKYSRASTMNGTRYYSAKHNK